jgi:hypothetical protein
MTLHSFDTPVKRCVRAEYREFLRTTILRHKKAKDVKVLCLPGHEAVEIFEVYDRLGIPRKNIYGVEWKAESYKLLKAQNLGINLWKGDVFDYLGHVGVEASRRKGTVRDETGHMKAEVDNLALLKEQGVIASEGDVLFLVSKKDIDMKNSRHRPDGRVEVDLSVPGLLSKSPEGLDPSWLKLHFDIVALDICGHVTPKVLNAISATFRSEILLDRGVFTLTSLASREQAMTKAIITMAMMMDAIVRASLWEVAHDIRPGMVKYPSYFDPVTLEDDEDKYKDAVKQRSGLDALLILLGVGNDMFMELLKLYNKGLQGLLQAQRSNNPLDFVLLNAGNNPTSMVARNVRRLSYQSDHSHMRTSFIQFRSAQKTVHETGSQMEVIARLAGALSTDLIEIETPHTPELSKTEALARIREGGYSET